MSGFEDIREHMEVIGADGVHIGTVDRVEDNRIKLIRADSGLGHEEHHHFIPRGLVAEVDKALSARHTGRVFRDLVEIQVGEPAQEKIDEELARADVLVFFDTPKAGESTWVAHELAAGTLVKAFDLSLPGYRFYVVRTLGHPREKTIQAFSTWLQSVI